MKLEFFIFGITAFIVYNIYYDNKIIKLLFSYKKYYQMGLIVFGAIILYLMLKRNPNQSKNMLLYTNNLIKYMPIDRSSMDLISPIFDFTCNNNNNNNGFLETFNRFLNPDNNYNQTFISRQQRHILQNGQNGIKKRAVSETKKKYIASMQDWKCAQCLKKLTHTFEIDHKIRLEHGGGNDVTNLVAMCRECHGNKTAFENM